MCSCSTCERMKPIAPCVRNWLHSVHAHSTHFDLADCVLNTSYHSETICYIRNNITKIAHLHILLPLHLLLPFLCPTIWTHSFLIWLVPDKKPLIQQQIIGSCVVSAAVAAPTHSKFALMLDFMIAVMIHCCCCCLTLPCDFLLHRRISLHMHSLMLPSSLPILPA